MHNLVKYSIAENFLKERGPKLLSAMKVNDCRGCEVEILFAILCTVHYNLTEVLTAHGLQDAPPYL